MTTLRDSDADAHLWTPSQDVVIQCAGARAMHGGPQPKRLYEHSHDEIQCQVRFRPSGRSGALTPTGATMYAPQQPHAGGWHAGWEVVVLLLAPELLARTADELCRRDRCEIIPFTGERVPPLEQIAELLRREFHTVHGASRFYVESLSHVVAGYLVRHHATTATARHSRGALSVSQLRRIDRCIDEHLPNGLAVETLSAAVGLGAQRFTQRFQNATGLTPWQYVQQRRLEHARGMLAGNRRSIAEIAFELGFSSQAHFSAVFRAKMGMTPGSYRRLVRSDVRRSRDSGEEDC
jgi:AraC family transcriptional regulator